MLRSKALIQSDLQGVPDSNTLRSNEIFPQCAYIHLYIHHQIGINEKRTDKAMGHIESVADIYTNHLFCPFQPKTWFEQRLNPYDQCCRIWVTWILVHSIHICVLK